MHKMTDERPVEEGTPQSRYWFQHRPSFEFPELEQLVVDDSGNPLRFKENQMGERSLDDHDSARSFFEIDIHGLQYQNMITLAELLRRARFDDQYRLVEKVPRGPIFDAGCGDGLFLAAAPHLVFDIPEIDNKTIIAADVDPTKVGYTRFLANILDPPKPKQNRRKYIVEDPLDISDFDTTGMRIDGEYKVRPNASMVWCNSMFHWIAGDDRKQKTLLNFNRVAADDAVLLLSAASDPTAREFLSAYNRAVLDSGPYDPETNPAGYIMTMYAPNVDPIGRIHLGDLQSWVTQAGFRIIKGGQHIEEMRFAQPHDYVETVKKYGKKEFEKPFPHLENGDSDRLWERIEANFLDALKNQGWKEGDPYVYKQGNNYFIGVKVKRIPL